MSINSLSSQGTSAFSVVPSNPTFNHSKSQNLIHFLRSRELGSRVSLDKIKDDWLIQNISKGNCLNSSLNGHGWPIIAFDVYNYFIATASFDHTIKLWNLETRKCIWTFSTVPRVRWTTSFIKIVEGKVICAGLADTLDIIKYDKTIRIIDLQMGIEIASITDSRMHDINICIIENHIFARFKDGRIGRWKVDGILIEIIDSEKLPHWSSCLFFGLGDFLVNIEDNIIVIHDLQNRHKTKLKITTLHNNKPEITSAHIDGDRLICGFSKDSDTDNSPYCCLVDLKKGVVINKYLAKGAFLHTKINLYTDNRPYLTETGSIDEVVTNKEWVYLAHSTGIVAAINLIDKTNVVLGKHKSRVYGLCLDGAVLISRSHETNNHPAELKFWNIKSMTKLAEIELPSLYDVQYSSGKVIAAVENSLILRDYLISHKAEAQDANSALKIVRTECCIL